MTTETTTTTATEVTQPRARWGERGHCVFCHNLRVICSAKEQCCSTCWKKRRPPKVGPCEGCGRTARLPSRGLCGYCYARLPAGSGTPQFRTRTFSPEEIAAAKLRQEEFERYFLPAVQRHVRRRFVRRFRDAWVREELLAEAEAIAWKEWVGFVNAAGGVFPTVGHFARMVVRQVRHWQRLTGRVSTTDVMSPRTQHYDRVHCWGDCVTWRGDGGDAKAEGDAWAAWDEWVATLPASARRLLLTLQSHGQAHALASLGLTRDELERRLRELYGQWAAAARD